MMKKLLVVAAIYCAAVAAQAASVTAYNLGSDYNGYTIVLPYAFYLGETKNIDDQPLMFEGLFTDDSAKSLSESTTWSQYYEFLVGGPLSPLRNGRVSICHRESVSV